MEEQERNRRDSSDVWELIPPREGYDPARMEEYKMLREEIVNYMDKQQSLRNMIYVAMAACIAFVFSDDIPFICMLLPLLFLLPAYACACNYWICVRKASAYLVVFHECYVDCPFHWETRHGLSEEYNPKAADEMRRKSVFFSIYIQLSLYYVFALITILLYAFRLHARIAEQLAADSSLAWQYAAIDGIPAYVYVIIGVSITAVFAALFARLSMGTSYLEFLKKFQAVREKEEDHRDI